jgi:hypothetical protein
VTDGQAALAVSVCLNAEPKSLTWLSVQTGLRPSQVSRAIRLLEAAEGAAFIPGRGFIYWSPDATDALVEDVCRLLLEDEA